MTPIPEGNPFNKSNPFSSGMEISQIQIFACKPGNPARACLAELNSPTTWISSSSESSCAKPERTMS
ncbi:hypothetical protein YPPY72_4600 [Yersinia pestis PY-72]|nr:hypothetical protein YPPY72_4600 [Yersinia pestis PY-72]